MKTSDDMARLMTPVVLRISEKIRTGVYSLDRWPMRYRLAYWATTIFGERASFDLRLPRALMCIMHNETNGKEPFIGDLDEKVGPSIGPMQVSRWTAKAEKLWAPSRPGLSDLDEKQEFTALAKDEDKGIELGVRVFKLKLGYARGDVPLAVRMYNGSGPEAEKYLAKALRFAKARGWDLSTPSLT